MKLHCRLCYVAEEAKECVDCESEDFKWELNITCMDHHNPISYICIILCSKVFVKRALH